MRYLQINTGPWPSPRPSNKSLPWWSRALRRVFPSGNLPELEKRFPQTVYWWLEIDDQGVPQREIGFDVQKNAVVLGPIGDHIGYLTDASDDWRSSEGDSAEAADGFEDAWNTLWPTFEHLEDDDS